MTAGAPPTISSDQPLVSVVTVCLNAKTTLARTIDSVLRQTYSNREHIIVDGGSNDGTLDLLQQYGHQITWISEPDSGLYSAMNKGIQLARGQWIHLLNADDYYASDDALAHGMPHIELSRTNYFDIMRRRSDGVQTLQNWTVSRWMLYISAFLPHPGLIVSRDQYDAVGLYDTNLRIAADHDLILRLVRRFPPKHIPVTLAIMDQTGLSARSLDLSLAEFATVTCRHGLPAPVAEGIRLLKVMWWKVRAHA
jgi:glycosyltransferase involved in cell wall biosynthesis